MNESAVATLLGRPTLETTLVEQVADSGLLARRALTSAGGAEARVRGFDSALDPPTAELRGP